MALVLAKIYFSCWDFLVQRPRLPYHLPQQKLLMFLSFLNRTICWAFYINTVKHPEILCVNLTKETSVEVVHQVRFSLCINLYHSILWIGLYSCIQQLTVTHIKFFTILIFPLPINSTNNPCTWKYPSGSNFFAFSPCFTKYSRNKHRETITSITWAFCDD